MKNKFKSGIIVLISLIVIIVFVSILSFTRNSNSDSENALISRLNSRQFIAALYIEGTIQEYNSEYNQEWLISTIKNLKDNKKNVALAIYINSPGGTVYQADEVYATLQDYKTTGKPVYVYQGPMAASGGYYISCAANKIFANRNTLTGSIGVISGSSFDLTEFLNNLGIKSETIHSGKNKNMMNYNEPFTDEQKAIMQSICDECYQQFVSIVANNRGMSYEKVSKLADGRLYTARQALDNGLIDRIDTWDGMLDVLSEEVNDSNINVVTYRYERKMTFMEKMLTKAKDLETAKAASSLGLPLSVLNQMNRNPFEPMYLVPSN